MTSEPRFRDAPAGETHRDGLVGGERGVGADVAPVEPGELGRRLDGDRRGEAVLGEIAPHRRGQVGEVRDPVERGPERGRPRREGLDQRRGGKPRADRVGIGEQRGRLGRDRVRVLAGRAEAGADGGEDVGRARSWPGLPRRGGSLRDRPDRGP